MATFDLKVTNDKIENKVNDIPHDKHGCLSNFFGACPAFNSGKVVVKCLINGVSPFMATSLVNDTLFFNGRTFGERVLKLYPDSVKNVIQTFSGEEGVTFKSKVVYRHTYITALPKQGTQLFLDNLYDTLPSLTDEIENNKVYKEHQTFFIIPGLFDDDYLRPSEYSDSFSRRNQQCLSDPIWQYSFLNFDSWGDSPGVEDGINEPDVEIQYPHQTTTDTCSGFGVHWGVRKKTPLFKGEDFFIQFRKQSDSSDIPSFKDKQRRDIKYSSLLGNQSAFDSNAELETVFDANSGFNVLPNQAFLEFVDIDEDPDTGDTKVKIGEGGRDIFDFNGQSYYMVEIVPEKNEKNRYYIVICQKSNPIFVRYEDGITWRVSEFKGYNIDPSSNDDRASIGGRELIDAEWFRMEVKNYLGKIIIEFSGPGFQSTPWTIERLDIRKDKGNQKKILNIPRGRLGIFGGNILSGFLFGPLQYPDNLVIRHPSVSMSYGSESNENNDFSLPYNSSSQDILLDTSDQLIDTSNIENLLPGESLLTRRMFTQDAQQFGEIVGSDSEEIDRENITESDFRSKILKYFKVIEGSFFGYKSLREDPLNKDIIERSFDGDIPDDIKKEINGTIIKGEGNSLNKSFISVLKYNTGLDHGRRHNTFFLKIYLKSGDHSFVEPLRSPNGDFILDEGGNKTYSQWTLKNCVPPIITMIRLVARANETLRWNVSSLDVSDHVMNFTETWNASDFSKISHTGNIKFLVNEGVQSSNNLSEQLLSLRDKSFYIDIWAGYVPQGVDPCNYSKIPGLYKLFTGICQGGVVSRSYGRRVMDCKIDDYSDVLKNKRFFNAPFWDGVRDVNAMDELLEMAGFRKDVFPKKVFLNGGQEVSLNNYGPRHIVSKLASDVGKNPIDILFPDNRTSYTRPYALPSSYARLTQPFFKAKHGDSFIGMAEKIAERGGKAFFFDQFGIAHFENFFEHFQNAVLGGVNEEIPISSYTTNPDVWEGQLVFNNMTVQHDVQSTYNHIKLFTNDPNFTPVFSDDVNWDSYDDPGSEGFIGYLKMFYQAEGAIGSKVGTENLLNFYKNTLFKPPLVVNFESYGQPLRSLDLIYLNGVPLRVMKVSNTIDPSKNSWWQKIECEWSQWANPVPSDNLMTKNS